MKYAVKSLNPADDYTEIAKPLADLRAFDELRQNRIPQIRIDTPMTNADCNFHKMWEWSRTVLAIEEMKSTKPKLRILDIGAAFSLLGPYLASLGHTVIEADLERRYGLVEIQTMLSKIEGAGSLASFAAGYGGLIGVVGVTEQFDVVLSISTIEHVPPNIEREAWPEMVNLLRPGGLLVVTADVMPEAKKGYRNDAVRWTNYDMAMLKKRVDYLKSLGMRAAGEEDWQYHGDHVFDYSFFFAALRKNR